MFSKIISFIDKYKLIPPESSIIIGLSGGPDSIFLLHLLHSLQKERNLKLIAAHLDHEWRLDSAKDVEFCREATKKLGIEFACAKISELGLDLKFEGSQEELARRYRRYFLEQIKKKYNADLIALGQHLQDQEETFFIRLIRGTTLSGLIGIKPQQGVYVRPLLETNKKDILDYLDKNKIAYLTDPTNVEESFLRNRIRLKVLPALQECDNRFNQNFLRTLHNLQETEAFLTKLTEKTFEEISEEKDGTFYIDLNSFFNLDPFLQPRILMHWLIQQQVPFVPTEKFLDEIMRYLKEGKQKEHQIHETWSIKKEKNKVYLETN